ncbi:TPA: hypothetical protein KEY93_003186 [Klebsiella oxytoca]|nr:hypothetical protein [Klebsiella oxytoca]
MAYLPELPEWTAGVYQLEKSDPVRGGVDGPANRPLIDLLKRTAWLKQRYEEAFSGLGWAELGEWAVGLEVTTPSQIVHYQGYWYRYGGSLPHTITGDSPSLDDNDNWFNLGNDVSLRANLGSSEPGMGGDLSAWRRRKMMQAPVTVSGALDSQAVSIWEFAGNITDRPDINDPGTWDWSPAFQAAADAYIAPRLISGEKYTMRSTVTITVDTTSPTRYVKVPFCNDGLAIIDHSSLGNAGEGFNDALPVDDPSQPVRVPAFIIAGGSGTLLQQHMEGIYFIGNKNTCSVILKGCCGVRIVSCIFNANRQGIVFSNDVAAGVFTEACVAYNCRFRQACLVAITYEKGAGDSSFHGTGFDQTYITSPSGYPTILIGTGAQPYNAPVNGNIWTAGTAVAMIQNKGLTSHFYGSIKLEGSPKAILASDSKVFLYGEISTWSIVDKGTLVQAVRGGPTGPSGGNLQFAGITSPEVTRWDVAAAGTVVPFAAFNEKAIVTVRGSNYYATFEFSTSRHATGNAVTTPLLVSANNCNPLTKFKIAKTAGGLSLTTVENNTIITAYRWENMPDESSGMNFRSAGYWRKL